MKLTRSASTVARRCSLTNQRLPDASNGAPAGWGRREWEAAKGRVEAVRLGDSGVRLGDSGVSLGESGVRLGDLGVRLGDLGVCLGDLVHVIGRDGCR